MSRYIDADKVLMALRLDHKDVIYIDKRDTAKRIEKIRGIDIVRCKECKHNPWKIDTDYTCIWDDDFADREQTPDDFCSYGEREGE